MHTPVKRNILLNPGPATTTDTVKYAQVVPDICPREKEFCNVMETVAKDLVRVVNGDDGHEAVMFTASGTGGVEAMISSIIPEGGKLLVVINGAYGDRMQKMAEIYYSADRAVPYRIPYGDYPDVKTIAEMLVADPAISHIGVVHHETTTGMLNPVKEIARMAHAHDVEMIVDAVSSYAGIPIHIDDDGFDYLVSTSNKNIQGMAGIAFVIARWEKIENLKGIPKRNLYLNLYDQYLSQKKSGQMRFTPAVQVIYALKQALFEFFRETPEGRYTRYQTSWKVLVEGIERLGFRLFLPKHRQAGLITSIYEPDHAGFDFNAMHDHLYHNGYTIYPGKVADIPTFRIANIGAIDERDIKGFLDELGRYLDGNGIELEL